MRVALISDIHGHATALEAVRADMHRQQVDTVICLGDIATVGPQPRKVIAMLKDMNALCIMGNHDATMLNLEMAAEYEIASSLFPSLEWCAQQLTIEDYDFLRSLKADLNFKLDENNNLFCFHGSPYSKTKILVANTPPEEMDGVFAAQPSANIFAGGHSHIQMHRRHKNKLMVNPGSIGNAFWLAFDKKEPPSLLPWAEYGIITVEDGTLGVDLRRVQFDMAAFKETVMQSDMPNKNWWFNQYSEA